MSYDISLCDPVTHEEIEVNDAHFMRGGTYQVGGTTRLWLNVTYNYGPFYYKTLGEDGIRKIYGMTGSESIPILRAAADKLSDETDPDYWKSTPGNAKRALLQLIEIAKMRPDGIWDGD